MSYNVPERYEAFNSQQTKRISIVVKIDGVKDILTNRAIYTRALYGDAGIYYGMPGLVYGGLRPYVWEDGSTYRDILALDGSSFSISQKLEPESGRASISGLSLCFVDRDGYMTELVSPGVVLPEILGRQVEVFQGYEEISYPQDYFPVFRGVISEVTAAAGSVTLQISDPNIKRRKQLFFCAKTKITAPVESADGIINVGSSREFFYQVIGAGNAMDPAITPYVKIGEEWIKAGPYGLAGSQLGGIRNPEDLGPLPMERGARHTLAAAHEAGADVSAAVEIEDDAISLALKLQLSGWMGPFVSGVPLFSIGSHPDPEGYTNTTDLIVLPPKVDAKRDYGLVEGDLVTLTGSIEGNNGNEFKILGFQEYEGHENRVIVVDYTLFKEGPSPATAAFRSQFDTYPPSCGLKLTPKDIDVEKHIEIKNSFQSVAAQRYRFFITSTVASGKEFIETQIYLPAGLYSVTRRGKLSVGITKPPIADQNLVVLDSSNILDPKSIRVQRSMTGRAFFNEIQYSVDHNDDGEATAIYKTIDSESLSVIGLSSVLKIDAQGVKSDLGAQGTLEQIALRFLSRYKRGAVSIPLKVNWEAGNLIEAGDVIAIKDDGDLRIANFESGARNIGIKLFEVVDRQLDMKSGTTTLKVTAGVGAEADDRFATIAPTSVVGAGSTASRVIIRDSFQSPYVGNEQKKWTQYIGLPVLVHSYDYSQSAETALTGFDPTNNYAMQVSPALPFVPAAGFEVDIAPYPTSADPMENRTHKVMHAFFAPTVAVTAGASQTTFSVGAGDIGKFRVGATVIVHNEDYSEGSPEVGVAAIDGNDITVSAALGFVPDASHVVEGIGFADGGNFYRYV